MNSVFLSDLEYFHYFSIFMTQGDSKWSVYFCLDLGNAMSHQWLILSLPQMQLRKGIKYHSHIHQYYSLPVLNAVRDRGDSEGKPEMDPDLK